MDWYFYDVTIIFVDYQRNHSHIEHKQSSVTLFVNVSLETEVVPFCRKCRQLEMVIYVLLIYIQLQEWDICSSPS